VTGDVVGESPSRDFGASTDRTDDSVWLCDYTGLLDHFEQYSSCVVLLLCIWCVAVLYSRVFFITVLQVLQ